MRREIGKWADEPKSAESRRKRAEKMAERMMLAMDGEDEPPPVLRAAFLRQPRAREGWNALTPTQRRSHLLGIFYYETPRLASAAPPRPLKMRCGLESEPQKLAEADELH